MGAYDLKASSASRCGNTTSTATAERWLDVGGVTVLTTASAARAFWIAPHKTTVHACYIRAVNDSGASTVKLYVDGSEVDSVAGDPGAADTEVKYSFEYTVAAGSKIGVSHACTSNPGGYDWSIDITEHRS